MKNQPYNLFFDALANESRLAILHLLQKGPRSVLQIADSLDMEQSAVSHNLSCLSRCGFVRATRNGKQRIYRLNGSVTRKLLTLIDQHIDEYRDEFIACGILHGRKKCD